MAAFTESEHSRLPVYRDSLDDPVGVAHLKDVFKLLAQPAGRQRRPATPCCARLKRETLYVPPSMRAADLLVRMQASRIHMAMVIDEFGGVDGLVTLEDVIEAVVGEIDDEHDEAAAIQIVARAGGVFEIDARVALEAFEAALGRRLATPDMDEDIDTAAGPGHRPGRPRAAARRGDRPSGGPGFRDHRRRSATGQAPARSPRRAARKPPTSRRWLSRRRALAANGSGLGALRSLALARARPRPSPSRRLACFPACSATA